jgi:rare lipoprotein A
MRKGAQIERLAGLLVQWPAALVLMLAALVVTGCGHHHKTAPQAAPPQATAPVSKSLPKRTTNELDDLDAAQQSNSSGGRLGRIPITPAPPGGVSAADLDYVATHKPILSETGFATWYTAPYVGRKAANGQVFNDDALTAAHRTLPMGSLIVVNNLRTGQSSAMRVTDRGPFVDGRMLDLTVASAKATGVYPSGLVEVRMDVYRTPKPVETGGRWCVQIGAFKSEREAIRLKNQLLRKYSGANVIEFPGEKSYWVRIRPEGDDRAMAEEIASRLRPSEGEAFLTRLD